MEYFAVLFKDDDFGVAYLEKGQSYDLPYYGRINNWQPLIFDLQDGNFSDYLANNQACRLCSKKLRQIIDSQKGGKDSLQWLPVIVNDKKMETEYFILHFPEPPDILNKEKTKFIDDFVVKPVFSSSEVHNHSVFTYINSEEPSLFMNSYLKQIIEDEGLTGIEFSQRKTV